MQSNIPNPKNGTFYPGLAKYIYNGTTAVLHFNVY